MTEPHFAVITSKVLHAPKNERNTAKMRFITVDKVFNEEYI